ncbi:MAG TPA: S41 family peptidase [Acetobacteraceae bacterium]|nr:S41 family peptidase [Acetobacteraceae bacterium]
MRKWRGKTVLLLAAAFVAGIAIVPTSDLIARRFTRALGFSTAFAQDTDRTETYKLLALFGDAFELVRSEYVDPVSDKQLIENALNGMLTGLDPHSSYLDAAEFRELEAEDKGRFSGVGMDVALKDGMVTVISPVEDTPAFHAGIKAGDIIIALNGRAVRRASAEHIIDQMRGPPNTKITVTIKRVGVDHPLVFSMRREIIRIKVVKQRMETDNVGYVRITEFTEPVDAALKQAVRSLRRLAGGKLNALIVDLRDNPGGLLDQAVAVARDFIPHGEVVSISARHSDDSEWVPAKGIDILDGAPLVVLINSGTASASEVVAGALQDHQRAVLVGTRSFGKGSVQVTIPLRSGGMLLTMARYHTPSGRSIQGRGIMPDVLVADSPDRVAEFDPEYEAELNHVIGEVGGTPDSDEPREDLPPILKTIPSRPPKDFPEFDLAKPETDFQLQQARVIARAMATSQKPAGTADRNLHR